MTDNAQIAQIHRTTYRESLKMALQQKDSRLLKTITDVDVSGELAKLDDLVGESEYQQKTGRNSKTTYSETPHDGRWVAMPDPIFYAELTDKEDKLASGVDVTGIYTKGGSSAIARGTDAEIIRGIFGTAQTGKKGTILTPFDSANIVPVATGGAASGLNVEKLNAANEILRGNDVDLDEEECWVPITAKQNGNLLNDIKVTNKDYGATGAEITDGLVRKLFGFNFAHIELGNTRLKDAAALTVDGSGYRKVPFYTKSGIYLAFWERMFASVDLLPTTHFSTQIYARRQCAASRSEEGKVGYIECNEA